MMSTKRKQNQQYVPFFKTPTQACLPYTDYAGGKTTADSKLWRTEERRIVCLTSPLRRFSQAFPMTKARPFGVPESNRQRN